MPGCAAVDCSNRSEQGYVMKVFPRDPVRRSIWAAKVKREGWNPTNNSYLCEVHFDDDQWSTSNGARQLSNAAVPTLFNHLPFAKKRKLPTEREVGNKNVESENTLEKCISDLQNALSNAQQVISTNEEKIRLLEEKVRKLTEENSKLKKNLNSILPISKKFNADQLQAAARRSMCFTKWSNETIEMALGLRFSCGTRGYETILELNFPFPSVRTLQRRLQIFTFPNGILEEVFHFLKVKVATFSKEEKECVLLLDEMAIMESIDYDVSSNSFIGKMTLPESDDANANHALVIMLAGIYTRWKQVVAYFYTRDPPEGHLLKNVILNVIGKAYDIGLIVNSITSDMCSGNQSMWSSFRIKCGRSECTNSIAHPFQASESIQFLADPPHLLKNIRPSLLNNQNFSISDEIQKFHALPTTIVDGKHLKMLIDFQANIELKLAPKLQEKSINLSHFDKMKVAPAATVLSHDVSAGLEFLSETIKDSNLKTTAWFFKQVHKWFKLMTSRYVGLAISHHNEQVHKETIAFLEDFIKLFRTLKIVGKNNKVSWKPIQTGVILSTHSIINLQEKFLKEKDFKFLLTSRFTQDAVENLFSLLRSKQCAPTALQFKTHLKSVCVAQYFKKCKGSYDWDDGQILDGLLNLPQTDKVQSLPKIVLPYGWDESPSQDLNVTEQNCLYSIAGYIVSRVGENQKVCQQCINFLGSRKKVDLYYSKLVTLREYKPDCLFYVNEPTFAFF